MQIDTLKKEKAVENVKMNQKLEQKEKEIIKLTIISEELMQKVNELTQICNKYVLPLY